MADEEKTQITVGMHWVPQFYLEKFTNQNGKLEILDCKLKKVVTPRTPKYVCKDDFFYSLNGENDEVGQEVEKWLQKVETQIAPKYDVIVRKILNREQIIPDDKDVIAVFMAVQYLRSPFMRKRIKSLESFLYKTATQFKFSSKYADQIIDKIEEKSDKKMTAKERDDLKRFAASGDYEIEVNNRGHILMFQELVGVRNMFFGKDWLVYISESKEKFITSDNPVAEEFPKWSGHFFDHPTFLEMIHYFPLTPDILIVVRYPNEFEGIKVKRKTLFDTPQDNGKILELNFMQPRHANDFVYANNAELLEELIQSAYLNEKQKMKQLKK